jgi:NitT/TauT family transport system substrate-binding protein
MSASASIVRAWIVGASACALLVLGCAGRVPVLADDTIHIGASSDDIVRPLLYATDAGLFKKVGLDVQMVKLANGAAVAAAVAGGSLELGKGSALTPVLAYAKGIPFTAIANLGDYTSDLPQVAMLVKRDSPFTSTKDLAGKTIGMVGLQDQNALSVYTWLEAAGVDLTTVKFVEVGNSAGLAATETGRVDAFMAIEPALTNALAAGTVRIFGYPNTALGKRYSFGILFATTAWVAAHRDAVDKIVRVVRDAEAYVAAHEVETIPLAAAYAGLDPATLQNVRPPYRTLTLTPGDLQSTIDAAAKYKLIPKAFPASEIICGCALQR